MFSTNHDIKEFLKELSKLVNDVSVKEECQWFSEINYTTCTEYYGELRVFLKKMDRGVLMQTGIASKIDQLIEVLDSVLG